MMICVLTLGVIVNVSEIGAVDSAGGANTLRVTPTDCGLPVMAMPELFNAASEIVPPYDPATSAAEVTATVKIAEPLAATMAEVGVTANQPTPLVIVAVGVTVTLPVHAPITPMVKVCTAGFRPVSLVKVSAATEGACNVHAGCTVSVTVTICGVPTGRWVTLSRAVMVMLPL